MKKIELGDNVCWYTPKGHIKGFLAKHHGNHKYCHGKIGVCISDKNSDMITIEDNTASRGGKILEVNHDRQTQRLLGSVREGYQGG